MQEDLNIKDSKNAKEFVLEFFTVAKANSKKYYDAISGPNSWTKKKSANQPQRKTHQRSKSQTHNSRVYSGEEEERWDKVNKQT